jgi:hypothetical protein
MLGLAFHVGSEEFRRCPGCVAAFTRASHLAAPIGNDWANLSQPEQRFRPRLATPTFSGTESGPNLERAQISVAATGLGHCCTNRRLGCVPYAAKPSTPKTTVQWKFKSADRGAGIDPDQYGGPWMARAKSWAMGFALIALNSVRRVQSVGSCAKPLC